MSTSPFDDEVLARLKRTISASRVEQILKLYLELSPLRMNEVQGGIQDHDLERAGRALHDMKSSAGMVGARRVEQLAREMEQNAADQDGAALSARVADLLDAVNEAERWVTGNRLES